MMIRVLDITEMLTCERDREVSGMNLAFVEALRMHSIFEMLHSSFIHLHLLASKPNHPFCNIDAKHSINDIARCCGRREEALFCIKLMFLTRNT